MPFRSIKLIIPTAGCGVADGFILFNVDGIMSPYPSAMGEVKGDKDGLHVAIFYLHAYNLHK